ncbi:hypothetical protein [Bacillus infantis]|uniref:hypothetical protein n=1 Tax=Bacillus infantis TaxID=324767 RepID=UPI003CEF29AA
MTLLNKVLIMEDDMYQAYNCVMLDDDHALFFTEYTLNLSRVYPTSESSLLYVEGDKRIYLATHIKIIDVEKQLEEAKEMILKASFHDYLTKVYEYCPEGSLGIIPVNDYKVKKV